MNSTMKKPESTTWQDVFNTWQSYEGQDPEWQRFAKEERGFDSWKDWRSTQSEKLGLAQREWMVCEIENPSETIPNMLMGPYNGWQRHFEEKLTHTFADLVAKEYDWIANHEKTRSLIADFPQGTQLIGLYLPWQDKLMCYEGHHRSAAIAVAAADGKPIPFEVPPKMAFTVLKEEEFEQVRHLLESGNAKQ